MSKFFNIYTIIINFCDGSNHNYVPSYPVVNVSVESLTLSTSELAGTVQINLLKTQNAIGPVSVMVVTSDGTAQSRSFLAVS